MLLPVIDQSTLIEITGALLGFSFGMAADKGFNESVKQQFHPKSPIARFFLNVILEGFHHFFIGLFLMIFTVDNISNPIYLFLYSFGFGLFLSEIRIFKKLFLLFEESLSQFLKNGETNNTPPPSTEQTTSPSTPRK